MSRNQIHSVAMAYDEQHHRGEHGFTVPCASIPLVTCEALGTTLGAGRGGEASPWTQRGRRALAIEAPAETNANQHTRRHSVVRLD